MNIPVLNNIKLLILKPFTAFLLALAVVYFIYGLYRFLANYDNPSERSAGKSHMIWGIVGITIMASVYGVIDIIRGTIEALK